MSSEVEDLRQFVFGALEQNRHWLTAYFLAATGSRDHAQDLAQEVFVEALKAAHTYNADRGSLGCWLRGIARHRLLAHGRQIGRNPLFITEEMLNHLGTRAEQAASRQPDPVDAAHRVTLLRDCLKTLTQRVRQIIEMKYHQRRPGRQIAAALGMNENAVHVALCRGRKLLQQCIEAKVQGHE